MHGWSSPPTHACSGSHVQVFDEAGDDEDEDDDEEDEEKGAAKKAKVRICAPRGWGGGQRVRCALWGSAWAASRAAWG